MKRTRSILRVLYLALAANVVVAALKLAYGIWTGTLTVIADGIHSIIDAGSSVMGIIAMKVSERPSDKSHHYGHTKYETIAALGISLFIALTAWEITKSAISKFAHSEPPQFHISGIPIVLLSLIVSALLSWYERKKGRELSSGILDADGYHTASDVWVSLSVLISLFVIRMGYTWADPVFSLAIAVYFAFIAYRLVRKNILVLTDAAFIDPEEIRKLVISVPGVIGCHYIRTRGKPGEAFIDLHIQVDPDTKTITSHSIAHSIEDVLRRNISGIQDVLIHTEPFPDFDDDTEAAS